MLIDSHCHIDFPELANDIDAVLAEMRKQDVGFALCASVSLEGFPTIRRLAQTYPSIFASVGVHPDQEDLGAVEPKELVRLADHPKVVAIGETGLDYYRLKGDLEWQRDRFRAHIRAAIECGKPLIIHTRSAAEDTIRLMQEESAGDAGGVMHCFTEGWEVARAALDMGFYISISGIVTFKNALQVKDVARRIPLERLLVETDSPYLAPVPHRGKLNQPAFVRYVAKEIAALREDSMERIEAATTSNFYRLFNIMENTVNV